MSVVKIVLRLLVISSLFCVTFSSCSLDYFSTESEDSESPEFIFHDAYFNRVENNNVTVMLTGSKIEQYNDGELTYVQNPAFELYDDKQQLSVEGVCDLVSVNVDTEVYSFYRNIELFSHENNAKITAQNLRWLGKEELFSSGKDEEVSVEIETEGKQENQKTKLFIRGKDFSASGFDFSYSFEGPVRGEIIENN